MEPTDPNEPYFLLNEYLAHDKPAFDEILDTIEKPHTSWEEKAIFLRNYTAELYKAYRRQRSAKNTADLNQHKQEYATLLKKKKELLVQLQKAQQDQQQKIQPQQPKAVITQAKPAQPNPEKIDTLITDSTVREIVCSGAGQPCIITKNGQEIPTQVQFAKEQELDTFVQTIATKLNQTLSQENPFLNAQLDAHTTIQGNITTPFLKAKFVIIKQ